MHISIPRCSRRRLATLALLLLLAVDTHAAQAGTVFKCRGSDGSIAFQDRPCASTDVQSEVDILPAPPPAPSPDYGIDHHATRSMSTRASRGRARGHHDAVSFECRAADGEVFYRHGGCPKSVTAKARSSSGRRGAKTESYAVSAVAMPRGEVCRRLAAAGSIGRSGHEHDETISTYEKNLGRDPCRRF